jgi:hypothetical protein
MRDDRSASGDLVGGQVDDWLVAGWFTPDYRPLAEAFAADLTEHGAPYHLWAKPSLGAWNTSRKPSVALEAMDAYPGRTVVLMDVDCVVRGDIAPMTEVAGDIGICAIARNVASRKGFRHWLAFATSSRVIVFRPTEGARTFATRWADKIASTELDNDEWALSWAYLSSPDLRFGFIPPEYSGRETGSVPDAVILHDSAHEREIRSDRSGLSKMLRNFERRWLRTGRTRARKVDGQLSAILKA